MEQISTTAYFAFHYIMTTHFYILLMQTHLLHANHLPIRIDFHIPRTLDTTTLQEGTKAAAAYFADRVNVTRRPRPYLLCGPKSARNRCYPSQGITAAIPDSHFDKFCSVCTKMVCEALTGQSQGIETDLMIYVSQDHTCSYDQDGNPQEAQAITYQCLADYPGRPIAAHVVIKCLLPSQVAAEIAEVFIHELTHALGFAVYHFEALGLITPLQAWKVGRDTPNKTVNWLTGDTVKSQARYFFNCPTLPGLPLNPYDSSHWPESLMPHDAINPIARNHWNLSRISLAALYDTGWYITDMNKVSNQFVWGKGCAFVMNETEACVSEAPKHPDVCKAFDPLRLYESGQCSVDRSYKECCYKGDVNDPCSYFKRCRDPIRACADLTDADQASSALLETVGKSSLCFEINLQEWDVPNSGGEVTLKNYPTACYNHLCQGGKLFIKLNALNRPANNQTLECPNKGGKVDFQAVPKATNSYLKPSVQIKGSVYCPSYESVCVRGGISRGDEDEDNGSIDESSDNRYLFGVIFGSLALIVVMVLIIVFLLRRAKQKSHLQVEEHGNLAPPVKAPAHYRCVKVSKNGVRFVKAKKATKG